MLNDIFAQAYAALKHNKSRSLLTMLGMAWGIATVVLLLAYGAGFERALMSAFESFAGQIVGVFPGRTSLQAGGTKAGTEIHFTADDIDHLRAEVPEIRTVSPQADKQSTVSYGDRAKSYSVTGSYATYFDIRHAHIGEGSLFTSADDDAHNRVAVLGFDVKRKLFSGQNALGQTVRIDGISYVVVGILKHTLSNGDNNLDQSVFIPFSAMSDLRDIFHFDGLWINYEGQHEQVAQAVRNSMAVHHNFDPKDRRAVFVFDAIGDMADLQAITVGIKVLLGFIGLLTLGIGGVGLMNIMLVSVTQRTREIGVEKALGARRWHILVQFLSEAMVITVIGGVAGVILAYLVSWSVGSLTLWSAFIEDASEGDIHLKVDAAILLWSTGILGIVGLVSGMIPAIKASGLNPIEALRYE